MDPKLCGAVDALIEFEYSYAINKMLEHEIITPEYVLTSYIKYYPCSNPILNIDFMISIIETLVKYNVDVNKLLTHFLKTLNCYLSIINEYEKYNNTIKFLFENGACIDNCIKYIYLFPDDIFFENINENDINHKFILKCIEYHVSKNILSFLDDYMDNNNIVHYILYAKCHCYDIAYDYYFNKIYDNDNLSILIVLSHLIFNINLTNYQLDTKYSKILLVLKLAYNIGDGNIHFLNIKYKNHNMNKKALKLILKYDNLKELYNKSALSYKDNFKNIIPEMIALIKNTYNNF